MNFRNLLEEKCAKDKSHGTMKYIENVEQYVCEKCQFGVYKRTFERLTVGKKNNLVTKAPMKHWKQKAEHKTTMKSYELAKGNIITSYDNCENVYV